SRLRGCWSLSHHTLGEIQEYTNLESTPDHSPIYRRTHTLLIHTLIPMGNLASPVSLPACLWTMWEETRVPRGNPCGYGRTCKLYKINIHVTVNVTL
ncbi:hypothetical protein ANANG_G00301450, partial [Anguilla anguilla]